MCMTWIKKLLGKLKKNTSETRFDMIVRYSDVAVRVTSLLKRFAEGKLDNFIVSLIPGTKDDVVWAIVESQIPHFAMKTALVNSILKAGQKDKDPVVAIAKYINTLKIEGQEEFYAKFAARLVLDIAEARSDGKFEFAEVLAISQARFLELKQAGKL
jgi:hypothetical protein